VVGPWLLEEDRLAGPVKSSTPLWTGIGRSATPRLFGRASNYARTADNFLSPGDYKRYFRFAREDVAKVVDLLRLSGKLHIREGHSNYRIDGEEAFLIFCRRLATPSRLVDLQFFFQRGVGSISEIIAAVMKHLEPIARSKLDQFDFAFWSPLFKTFAAKLQLKGCVLRNCLGFVDGVFRSFCRPGREGQRGAFQRAFYSGYKKAHGIEFQGVVLPNGIVAEMNGPWAGSRNDKQIMEASGFATRLFDWVTENEEELFFIYGDRGYQLDDLIVVPFCKVGAADHEVRWNREMSKQRVAVEWAFGEIAETFAFCAFPQDLKLDKQPVASYWLVATLLYNCRSCLVGTGNQVNQHFDVGPPDLEAYLA